MAEGRGATRGLLDLRGGFISVREELGAGGWESAERSAESSIYWKSREIRVIIYLSICSVQLKSN